MKKNDFRISVKFVMFFCLLFLFSCNIINSEKESNSTVDSTAINLNTENSDLTAASNNVKELYNKQRLKNIEHFMFTNSKGFTYKGKGGTVLVFPPNVFDCNDKDSIKMEICEFTDLTSMIQANLSTLSNDKMLESNGMVYCKAYCNNKEIELKKGKSFKCMFNKPKSKDFKLFEGEDAEGIINWKNPINEVAIKNNVVKSIKIAKAENTKKEALTICTYGTPNDISDIENSLKFSEDPSNHIISYFIDNYDIAFKDLIPFAPNESIMLNFILTKTGRLKFIDSENPINPKFKAKLIGYFEKMPLFDGYTNAETGEKEDLPLYFAICPNKLLNERLENDNGNMSKVNQAIVEKEQEEKERQLEIEKEQKSALEKVKKEYDILEKNIALKDKIDESTKIIFKVSKMGWINCDRFYNDTRQKVDLSFLDLDQFTSFNIQLVFTKINSIYSLNGSKIVNRFPIDEPIKIVFVGMKNTELFFLNKTITTSKVNNIALDAVVNIKESELNTYIEKSFN